MITDQYGLTKKDKNKWHIFSILGAKKEIISEKKYLLVGKYLKRSSHLNAFQLYGCLVITMKNFQKAQHKNYKDFSNNPGKFLGKEIPNIEPINASWDEKIYLVH